MSERALILCVDDEPVNLTIMEELLQETYALSMAGSGEICLQQVEQQHPDLILLDVNMPDLDGLETCRRLRSDPDTADIPIIFISALASNEELVAGYEAGGDDYITKPFSEDILQKKIDVVLAGQRRKQELKLLSDEATEALRDTLSETGELGMVVGFLHHIRSAGSCDDIAQRIFDCLREFELDSSLLIVADPENQVWFSDDINRPMERQILESLRGQDSVVSFGTRLAISSDNATILVRSLPTEAGGVERLRELLSIMIEGVEARLNSLQSDNRLQQQRSLLMRMLEHGREQLAQADGDREAPLREIVDELEREIGETESE